MARRAIRRAEHPEFSDLRRTTLDHFGDEPLPPESAGARWRCARGRIERRHRHSAKSSDPAARPCVRSAKAVDASLAAFERLVHGRTAACALDLEWADMSSRTLVDLRMCRASAQMTSLVARDAVNTPESTIQAISVACPEKLVVSPSLVDTARGSRCKKFSGGDVGATLPAVKNNCVRERRFDFRNYQPTR